MSSENGNQENEEEGIVAEAQNVVPLDHVEAVLSRVIPDLENALHRIQDTSSVVSRTPNRDQFITKIDLENALALMRIQMVTEIRF